jgi:putative ABC transport system substrate-binding protein
LSDSGYVESKNVVVEYRWTEGRNHRLAPLLADLIRQRVDVIAVPGNTAGALAAKAATQTIPVIFLIGPDPVELGLVASLARPGGNITGVAQLMVPVLAKRLEILHQLVPHARVIALLVNPTNPLFGEAESREVQKAASILGLQVKVLAAKNEDEIDASFASLKAQGVDALLVGGDGYLLSRRYQIAPLAERYRIPVVSQYRQATAAGGLMSYGNDLVEAYRLTGVYVARILKGEKPGDLPVQQPTKFELVINLKTAKSLAIEVPPTLLALADEVIE